VAQTSLGMYKWSFSVSEVPLSKDRLQRCELFRQSVTALWLRSRQSPNIYFYCVINI
jgi:hypothetical protein